MIKSIKKFYFGTGFFMGIYLALVMLYYGTFDQFIGGDQPDIINFIFIVAVMQLFWPITLGFFPFIFMDVFSFIEYMVYILFYLIPVIFYYLSNETKEQEYGPYVTSRNKVILSVISREIGVGLESWDSMAQSYTLSQSEESYELLEKEAPRVVVKEEEIVGLSFNGMEMYKIPDSLAKIESLMALNLAQINLKEIDLALMKNLTNLNVIDLRNNQLVNIDLTPLQKHNCLKMIDLRGNGIRREEIIGLELFKEKGVKVLLNEAR